MDLRTLASELITRARFTGRSGVTFKGKRDLYEALGYKRVLTTADYRDRYERNAVAGRIVDAKPQDTWRGEGELIEDDDPAEYTDFEKAWDELNRRLRVWSIFQRVDILAGLGHYAVLLIGAPGDMSTPLVSCKAEDIAYLQPFAEDEAQIAEYETNKTDPRFGLPRYYNLTRKQRKTTGTSVAAPSIGQRVHHSRIIHVADGLLDDSVFGTPRLERVWNLLDDLEKVTGGGAEAFWKRADQGLQLDLDPTMDLDDAAKKALEAEVENYTHGLKKIMRTRGLKVNSLGSDVADFKNPVESIMAQLSTGTGIPQRILMGSEQAKLAAEQDRTNWDERIEARRSEYAEPQIVRAFVGRMIELGALPEPKKEYRVAWSQIRTKNDAEKADLAHKWALVNSVNGETVVTVDEIRDRCFGMGPLDEDQLTRVVEKAIESDNPEVIEALLGIRLARREAGKKGLHD